MADAICWVVNGIERFCQDRHVQVLLLRKFAANHVLGGNADIVEDDFPGLVAHHRLVLCAEFYAGRIHIDEEAGYAALRALRTIRRDHELNEISLACASDETLGAVDDITIAFANGSGLDRTPGVRAAAGLADGRRPVLRRRLPDAGRIPPAQHQRR